MKKLTALFLLISALAYAQTVPQGINYQAIARSSSGSIMASQPVTVEFKIFNSFGSGSVSYIEDHNVTTNQLGYFNLVIGQGSPVSGSFSGINWSTGNASYEVYLNGALLGTETKFFSAPYALYAAQAANSSTLQAGPGIAISSGVISNTAPNQTVTITGPNVTGSYPNYSITAGNTLPTGTSHGNTLFWNGTTSAWQESQNLFNDNQHVGVGISSVFSGKFHVNTITNTDSSVIFAGHANAVARTAGVRSFIVGNSPLGQYNTAISGGHFHSRNLGQGPAVGIIAEGESNNALGTAIGIYATTYGSAPNRWAAMFEGGGVKINDSLVIGNSGNPGDIMTRTSTGRAVWTNPSAISTSNPPPVNFSANGSNNTIAPGTVAAVTFQNIDYNGSGAFNNTVFTAPSNGVYHFDGSVTLDASSVGGNFDYQLQIMVGGGTYRVSTGTRNSGQQTAQAQISVDIFLSTGTQVQLGFYHNAGGNLPVYSQINYTYFTGHKVN